MAFLTYDIAVVGQDKVRAAMRGIESELLASNRRTMAKGRGVNRATVRNTAKNEEAAKLKETEKAERERLKLHTRTEREKTRVALAEARKREQAEASLQRQRSAALLAEQRRQERAAESLQRQRSSALMRRHLAEERAKARAQDDFRRTTRGVLGGTASRVASVGKGAVALAGIGGTAIFASGAHGAMKKQAAASNLANQLLGNDATVESLSRKKSEILATVGSTRGFASEDVIAGMSKFQGTAGEQAATMKMAPILTQMSLATEASMEDLGDMYASMYAAIRNSAGGSTKSVDEIIVEVEKLGRVFGAMGQVGAIELKDIASVGSELTAAAMIYEGDIAANIQKVGAMMQIAKQTGGAGGEGGNEASTSVQNFANDLVNKQSIVTGFLRSSGSKSKDIFAEGNRGKLKSLDVLLPELMAATGGDLDKMGEILGIRGTRGLKGFSEPYKEAYDKELAATGSKEKAKEAGKKAVSARFKQFSGIEMSKGEVEAKATSRLADADKMLEEQMRNLTSAVGAELLPEIIKLIPEIARLVPVMTSAARVIGNVVKFIGDAPLQGLGAIIGVAFAVELGKAKIGSLITSWISRMPAPGGGAPDVDGGGGGGKGGKVGAGSNIMGAVGTGAALGAAAYTGISYEGRSDFDVARKGTNEIMSGLSGMHGSELGLGIVEAENKLKAIQDEAGLFGKFMDIFGAGPSGEIESARKMIDQKRQEYQEFRATGKLTPEQEADIAARRDSVTATENLTTAINKMVTALPSVSINTSNKPTTPAVK